MNRLPLLTLLLAMPLSSLAAEVTWDGHYRARGEYYNSLSLSDTNSSAEGASSYIDHRLRLQPGWLISERVSVHTQVDLLPYTLWGDEPAQLTDPVSGETDPIVFTDSVQAPLSDDGAATYANLKVTRLWGEVNTNWGQVRMGRVPVHWGTGMVFNAGNAPDSEFGDTVDRLQVAGRASEVFLMGGFETRYEGYIGDMDDYKALVGSVLYATELASLGVYTTYRWQKYDETSFGLWIGDLWGQAELGPATIQGEFAAVVGNGDLDNGANDVGISSFGANLDVGLNPDKLRLGLGFGLAGGDADPEDSKLHTFSYDPDFNVALMLFEEPMPILESAVKNDSNGGRDTDAVQSGYSVSNAVYLRPRVGWRFRDDLVADLSLFAAQQAKVADTSDEDRKGYGSELDLTVRYDPFPHFTASATGGMFFPGKFFSEYEHDDLGSGFDKSAFGARLMGTFEF